MGICLRTADRGDYMDNVRRNSSAMPSVSRSWPPCAKKRFLRESSFRPVAVLGCQDGADWRASFSATAWRTNSLRLPGIRRTSERGSLTETTCRLSVILEGYYHRSVLRVFSRFQDKVRSDFGNPETSPTASSIYEVSIPRPESHGA